MARIRQMLRNTINTSLLSLHSPNEPTVGGRNFIPVDKQASKIACLTC